MMMMMINKLWMFCILSDDYDGLICSMFSLLTNLYFLDLALGYVCIYSRRTSVLFFK